MVRRQPIEAGHGAARTRKLSAISGGAVDAHEFDRLIHERTRLAIVSLLAVQQRASFSELKRLLGVTDGNLSVHARKLEDAGYVRCTKSFAERLPHTEYALTTRGRQALERYLAHMEALIRSVRGA